MKLTTRIIAVSFVTVLLMFGAATYFRIRTTYDDFEVQHRVVATQVANAMVEPLIEAWRVGGLTNVDRLLHEETVRSRVGLQLHWVWFDERTADVNRPHVPPVKWPSRSGGHTVSTIITTKSGQRQMHTYVTINLSPDRHGGLELTESLEPLDRLTWRRMQVDLAAISAFALASAGIAYATGIAWIARPLQALIAKTQQISTGDFGSPLTIKRRDELGELANALNNMCQRLVEQQAAIQVETERRLATLEQLRHADRLTSIGRLAAGIAHEMGTPLNVVAGRASLITTGRLSAAEVKSSAEAIKVEADRITAIVRELLDFARQRTPHRAVTDLSSLTAKTVELVQQLAEKQNVRIEIEPGSGNVAASVDSSQLQQVLMNLFVNALQAMPNGGSVRVEVCADQQHSPVASGEPHFARISITDQGTGIASDDLEHIFEPFFTTKDIGQGTGLGLSIAYGIIQEHGGRIDVTSEVGRGSCFNILLPAENVA